MGKSSPHDAWISALASANTSESLLFSHTTNRSRMPNRRLRSVFRSSAVGNLPGWADGSSTNDAHNTARTAANGRRAHHKCKVEG